MTIASALPPGCMPLGLSREQAATYCGVSIKMFDKLVEAGTLPKPVKMGRRVVWDRRRIVASFDRLQGLSPSLTGPGDPDPFLEGLTDG